MYIVYYKYKSKHGIFTLSGTQHYIIITFNIQGAGSVNISICTTTAKGE